LRTQLALHIGFIEYIGQTSICTWMVGSCSQRWAALHIGPSSFLVAVKEKEAVVLECGGRPALSAGVTALGRLLWAFKKPARLCRKNGSRVCGRGLGGEVEADPPAFAVRQRWVGGGVQPGRPRVGGDAVGVLELQGLRREVETWSSFAPIWSLKVRRLRWMTA
jgi:hypothetical protein